MSLNVIAKGTAIPELGTIARLRNLVPLRDRLLGRHHTDTALHLIETTDHRRYKMVTVLHTGARRPRLPRTERAAGRLARFACDGCVPAVRYMDDRRLIVDFVPGTVLTDALLDRQRSVDLAHFIALNQPPVEDAEYKSPDPARRVEALSAAGLLSVAELQSARAAAGRLSALDAPPAALCFSDSALKNYVLRPDGGICFIDVFGIRIDLVGLSLVRQLLSLPGEARDPFLEACLRSSPCARQLYSHLPEYCICGLLERSAKHIPPAHHGRRKQRTRARHKQRARVLQLSLQRLQHCLQLPNTPDAFYSWLTDASG
ncbi:MAG: hypothetical protein EA384_14350 [Spirochaetaceae bacterium]|nr:MAG: hypothetical protein EA384_14350 [Spirochaetaceae bacterium]